jgi:hypothetical protein
MKIILLTLIFGVLIYSCSSSKIGDNKTKYFDENNVEISKSVFDKSRLDRKFIVVQNDSLNRKTLTNREIRGKINNKESLDILLKRN